MPTSQPGEWEIRQALPLQIEDMAQLWHHSENIVWNTFVYLIEQIQWEILLIRSDDCCTFTPLTHVFGEWQQRKDSATKSGINSETADLPASNFTELTKIYRSHKWEWPQKKSKGSGKGIVELSSHVAHLHSDYGCFTLGKPALVSSPPPPLNPSLSTPCRILRSSDIKLHFWSRGIIIR